MPQGRNRCKFSGVPKAKGAWSQAHWNQWESIDFSHIWSRPGLLNKENHLWFVWCFLFYFLLTPHPSSRRFGLSLVNTYPSLELLHPSECSPPFCVMSGYEAGAEAIQRVCSLVNERTVAFHFVLNIWLAVNNLDQLGFYYIGIAVLRSHHWSF